MFTLFARHWWVLALRGILALLFGALALLLPHFTLIFLVVLFGVYAVMDGLSSGLSALLASWEKPSHRTFLGLEGVVALAVGVLTLVWPTIIAAIFFALLVVWALLGGSIMLLSALRLQRALQGEVVLALSGLSALAFGVLLLLFPRAGIVAAAWLIGLYALLAGTLLLVRAVRLRRRVKQHQHRTPPRSSSHQEDQGRDEVGEQVEFIPLEHHA